MAIVTIGVQAPRMEDGDAGVTSDGIESDERSEG